MLVDQSTFVALKVARKPKRTLFDVLGHPASADIDFEPPKMTIRFKPAEVDLD